MCSQLCHAVVQRLAAGWREGTEGPIIPRAASEAEVGPATTLGESVTEGTAGAWLPDQSLDDGPHRRSHPAGVRSALSPRPYRTVHAQPQLEPPEAGDPRHRAR